MDADRWQKIKGILEEALEVDPAERACFLDKRVKDSEIRREVESLLAFDGQNGDELEGSAFASADFRFAENHIGKSFGHYKILEKLGEGGMGAVYLAERDDGEFRQRVAVKVIPRGRQFGSGFAAVPERATDFGRARTFEYFAPYRWRHDNRGRTVSRDGVCRWGTDRRLREF